MSNYICSIVIVDSINWINLHMVSFCFCFLLSHCLVGTFQSSGTSLAANRRQVLAAETTTCTSLPVLPTRLSAKHTWNRANIHNSLPLVLRKSNPQRSHVLTAAKRCKSKAQLAVTTTKPHHEMPLIPICKCHSTPCFTRICQTTGKQ